MGAHGGDHQAVEHGDEVGIRLEAASDVLEHALGDMEALEVNHQLFNGLSRLCLLVVHLGGHLNLVVIIIPRAVLQLLFLILRLEGAGVSRMRPRFRPHRNRVFNLVGVHIARIALCRVEAVCTVIIVVVCDSVMHLCYHLEDQHTKVALRHSQLPEALDDKFGDWFRELGDAQTLAQQRKHLAAANLVAVVHGHSDEEKLLHYKF